MKTYEKIYDSNFKFKCFECGKYQSIFYFGYNSRPIPVRLEDGQNTYCEDVECNANKGE